MKNWASFGVTYLILVALSMVQFHSVLRMERTGLSVRIIHALPLASVESGLRSRSQAAGRQATITPVPPDRHLTPVRSLPGLAFAQGGEDAPQELDKAMSAAGELMARSGSAAAFEVPEFEAGAVGSRGEEAIDPGDEKIKLGDVGNKDEKSDGVEKPEVGPGEELLISLAEAEGDR